MSDGGALFRIQSDAQARVKAQMQEISINKNDVGGYEYNAAVTLIKQINHVLEQQLLEESDDGMVGLGSETPNTLTNYKSNAAINNRRRQETVDPGSTSGQFNNQHRRFRDHNKSRRTRRGGQTKHGKKLAEAWRKIKAKYLYNQVHDAKLIINMMIYLAAADEQHNHQEATAPENSKTANMINLGIERLQQLIQQPPSEYASTDRDKESAMAATDSKSSAETRYCTRGRKKDRKGRR